MFPDIVNPVVTSFYCASQMLPFFQTEGKTLHQKHYNLLYRGGLNQSHSISEVCQYLFPPLFSSGLTFNRFSQCCGEVAISSRLIFC